MHGVVFDILAERATPALRLALPTFVPVFAEVGAAGSTHFGLNMSLIGERGGTRTLDPMIKSHVLYRLSYALT